MELEHKLPPDEADRGRDRYRELRDRYARGHDLLHWRWNMVGNARLAVFLAAAACIVVGVQLDHRLFSAAAGVALVLLAGLVAHHHRIGRLRRAAAALRDINRESILRTRRDWQMLPLRHQFEVEPGHPFAADLDLFGHASLFHLLETVETPMGAACLRDWLLRPAEPQEARRRQQIVAALAPELAWRQELALRGRLIGKRPPDPEPFLVWAEGELWLSTRPVLRWAAMLGPVLLISGTILAISGAASWLLALVPGIVNILLTQVLASEAGKRMALVATHQPAISGYADLLELIERVPGESAEIATLRERLLTGGAASGRLARIGRLTAFAVPPGSLLYYPLQFAFAWDINGLALIERWQRTSGQHARAWLAVIGETEGLAALATLAHDEPDWAMPRIDSALDRIAATNLGHPLLPDGVRVGNDVEVGPPGTFLLVTGSNMSGKSTLLRALGVNLVLAAAGGPVCASAFSAPPVRLWTSVRVEDSLERGVSFFMAELQRLKQIVDAATASEPAGRRLVFLLDEILQGTNTFERQIAARRVIRHLVEEGAIGVVSTHDLTLAEGPELAPLARAVHFRDEVSPAGMRFDYKLRQGVATSTNALRLMDLVFGNELAPIATGIRSPQRGMHLPDD